MTVNVTMERHPILVATAALVALTCFLTWPQVVHLRTAVAAHNDPYFSIWRLSWIAHALRTDPTHLYDGNIFYPAARTLAYSDATALEGALAAPFLWAHVSQVLVYNVLLLGAIAGSGVGMFVLARYLTRNNGAALVAAAVFTLLPYRIEHFMHLELQWTMWMPLAFWAMHRTVAERSWPFAMLTGVFLWLQLVSCVYYGIFLSIVLTALALMLLATDLEGLASTIPRLLLAVVIVAVLTLPYARPYLANARQLGQRPLYEIGNYSARPLSYVSTAWPNWWWGWTADRFSGNELRLGPGIVAAALALFALIAVRKRAVWIYAILCALAVELSFGLNGHIYPWLMVHLAPIRSLRAPARFAILAGSALSVLVAFSIDHLQQHFRSARVREWICAGALILITLESGSAPVKLMDVQTTIPDIYKYVKELPPAVLAEFPMPQPGWLPAYDPIYAYYSTLHWRPLVNGYSGYASPEYLKTIASMLYFPDDASIARLRMLDVKYVILHRELYTPADFTDMMLSIAGRRELVSHGRYRDWEGSAEIFELTR